MNILIASDSYKGSLSSLEVGNTIKQGILSVIPDCNIAVLPIGDGGEGTVVALVDATKGHIYKPIVYDPLFNEIESSFGVSKDNKTAFIEMAAASGLTHIPLNKRNPYITSTYGTGQLIREALDKGVKKIIIGIGGSGTNDGGIGAAAALGVRFLDKNNKDIETTNKGIESLCRIDISSIDSRIKNTKIIVACDVNNTLTGLNGASYIYGKQKGADDKSIITMDNNLKKLQTIIKEDLNIKLDDIAGGGAAGGLGAGLHSFLNGELKSGIEIVLDFLKFDDLVKKSNIVITGEGKFDNQTLMNKAPYGVAKRANAYGVKVIGISGVFGDQANVLLDNGFSSIFSVISKISSLEETYSITKNNLLILSKSIAALISD